MNKINFKNLPSTETPLNAENLNQLQTNVEDAIEEIKQKSFLKISLSTDNIDISSTSSYESIILPINLISSRGSKISVFSQGDDNFAFINQGVSYVKVSAQVVFQENSINNLYGLQIKKNGSGIVESYESKNANGYYTMNIPDSIIPVQQGDVISLNMYFSNAGDTVKLRKYSYSTFLQVEEV